MLVLLLFLILTLGLATSLTFSVTTAALACISLIIAKFCSSASQLLLLLLCLELTTLAIFLLMGSFLSYQLLSLTSVFSFFTFAVCEASLGLALLIKTARSSGNDYCLL